MQLLRCNNAKSPADTALLHRHLVSSVKIGTEVCWHLRRPGTFSVSKFITLLKALSEKVAARSLRKVTGKASICDTLNTFGSAYGLSGGEMRSRSRNRPSALLWGETQSGRSMQKGSRPISGAEQQPMEVSPFWDQE